MRAFLLRNGHLLITTPAANNEASPPFVEGRFAHVEVIDRNHPTYRFWLRRAEPASDEMEAMIAQGNSPSNGDDP